MERLYFNPEDICNIDKSKEPLIEDIMNKVEKIIPYIKNQHENHIAMAKTVLWDVKEEFKDKTIVIPARAGYGKSVIIRSILESICKESPRGMIIITDRIEDLRALQDYIYTKLGYYNIVNEEIPIEGTDSKITKTKVKFKYTALIQGFSKEICTRNKSDFNCCKKCYCKNDCILTKQYRIEQYSPVLLMSNVRYTDFVTDINKFRKWIDKDGAEQTRDIVIIDEKANIIAPEAINISYITNQINLAADLLSKCKSNEEVDIINTEFEKLLQSFNNLFKNRKSYEIIVKNGEEKEHILSQGCREIIDEIDPEFLKKKEMLRIQSMFTEGAIIQKAKSERQNTAYVLHRNKLNIEGYKVILFDATAEIDPDYASDDFIFLRIEDDKMYNNLVITNYQNINCSKSTLDSHPYMIKKIAEFIKPLLLKQPAFVVSYMDFVEEFGSYLEGYIEDSKGKIPHFNNTKGSNSFKSAITGIIVGWQRLQSIDYLVRSLSRKIINYSEWFSKNSGMELNINLSNGMFDENYEYGKHANEYIIRHLAANLEQEMFRTKIRNYSANDVVHIYLFNANREVLNHIKSRLGCMLVYNLTEIDCSEEKVLSRNNKNKKDNKIQSLIKWVKEYDGKPILVNDFKDDFQLSEGYWNKLFSSNPNDSSIKLFHDEWNKKNIKKQANKSLGKGKWIYAA